MTYHSYLLFQKKAEKKFGNQSTPSTSKQDSSVSHDLDIGDSESSEEESDTEEGDKGLGATFTGIDDTADQDDSVLFIKRRNVEVEPMPLESEVSTQGVR